MDSLNIPFCNRLITDRAMAHDEVRFPDPSTFNPERHLTPEGKVAEGTATPTFGLGRYVLSLTWGRGIIGCSAAVVARGDILQAEVSGLPWCSSWPPCGSGRPETKTAMKSR